MNGRAAVWSVELRAMGALEQPEWVRLRQQLEPYALEVEERPSGIDGIAIRIQVMAHDVAEAERQARQIISAALPTFIQLEAGDAVPLWLREGKSDPPRGPEGEAPPGRSERGHATC
jgi:hypothetical protein